MVINQDKLMLFDGLNKGNYWAKKSSLLRLGFYASGNMAEGSFCKFQTINLSYHLNLIIFFKSFRNKRSLFVL